MIKGDAVTQLTVMFLQIWYFTNLTEEKIMINISIPNPMRMTDMFNLFQIAL